MQPMCTGRERHTSDAKAGTEAAAADKELYNPGLSETPNTFLHPSPSFARVVGEELHSKPNSNTSIDFQIPYKVPGKVPLCCRKVTKSK